MRAIAKERNVNNEEFRKAANEMTIIFKKSVNQDNSTIKMFMDYLTHKSNQLEKVKKRICKLKDENRQLKAENDKLKWEKKDRIKKYSGKMVSCKYKKYGCPKMLDNANQHNYKKHVKKCDYKQ